MRLSEIEAQVSTKKAEMRALLALSEKESRDFTPEEERTFDALESEIENLNAKLQRELKVENRRKQLAIDTADTKTPEEKVAEKFSFVRALKCLTGKRVDGVEAEMSQEASAELRNSGVSATIEGVGIPSWLVNIKGSNVLGQKRDLTSGGTATGLEYVAELEKMHQFGLEIAPKALGLGVEVWTGLTGNVYVNETGQATSVWETEVATNDETTPATSRPFTLSPKRLGAFTDVSKTLLAQTSGVAEERVRMQLQKAQNRKLDETIFQGSGSSPIPYGILNTTNVNSVTSGGALTRQHFWDMWEEVASDNADFGSANIAMTAAIYAYCANQTIDAGSGRFILENGQINGVPVSWSNNMPANNILMGDFSKFVLGVWGGVDLVINPYTKGKEATVEVIINQFFDMGCLYPGAFCKITDASV